jgi:hypothetical protein
MASHSLRPLYGVNIYFELIQQNNQSLTCFLLVSVIILLSVLQIDICRSIEIVSLVGQIVAV